MKLSAEQFKKVILKILKTPYIPEKVMKEIRNRGYGDYFYYSISKEKAIKIIKELKKDNVLPKLPTARAAIKAVLKEG